MSPVKKTTRKKATAKKAKAKKATRGLPTDNPGQRGMIPDVPQMPGNRPSRPGY